MKSLIGAEQSVNFAGGDCRRAENFSGQPLPATSGGFCAESDAELLGFECDTEAD
jgi:hypothetical protein